MTAGGIDGGDATVVAMINGHDDVGTVVPEVSANHNTTTVLSCRHRHEQYRGGCLRRWRFPVCQMDLIANGFEAGSGSENGLSEFQA